MIAPDCRIELTSPTRLFTPEHSWALPRAGAIPPGVPGNPGPHPIVVMTLQTVALESSDVFSGLHMMRTRDLGAHWETPVPVPTLGRQTLEDGSVMAPCDFSPRWHAASGQLLGTGHLACYRGHELVTGDRRVTTYAFYDSAAECWGPLQKLAMPENPRFASSGAGATQRYDLPGGDILLPIYFRGGGMKTYASTVLRCAVVGDRLEYRDHGSELTIPVDRGFCEPSITHFNGRFYLTIRNDQRGYVAVSDDGLHYDEPVPWCWDDGSDLGNYNTQQHWITHRDALFLAYTRRGAENDHVFRNRAPLFMAQVDPATLRVIRESERILMPNRGARLGNFAVTEVSPHETWVTDAEWMQPRGCERYGSDGSVWVTRILWETPA